MGGANVVDYAVTHPDQVEQLILIAPAGYMGATDYASVLLAPGVGEWLFTVFGRYYAHSSIKAEVEAERAPENMLALFDAQADYKGYSDALLSTLRHYPMGDFGERYRALGATDIPVTAIWGTADNIVPYTGAALMADAVPQLKLITLENGNHNITFGQPRRRRGRAFEGSQDTLTTLWGIAYISACSSKNPNFTTLIPS